MNRGKHQISRVDTPRAHGWQVRYERVGFVCYRFFSDSLHGGKRGALHAAKKLRDALELIAPERKTRFCRVKNGTITKCRILRRDLDGKRHYFNAYRGFLRVAEGRHAQTVWSIDKWGERRAKLGVLAWLRKKQCEQLKNYGEGRVDVKAKRTKHQEKSTRHH